MEDLYIESKKYCVYDCMRNSKFTSKYQVIFRRERCNGFNKAGRGIEASKDPVRRVKATLEFLAHVTDLGVLSIAFGSRLRLSRKEIFPFCQF